MRIVRFPMHDSTVSRKPRVNKKRRLARGANVAGETRLAYIGRSKVWSLPRIGCSRRIAPLASWWAMLHTFSLRAWSALACLSFALATRVASAEEKISEEAKLYFQNGVELIQNQPPNYQDAYYQFKLAWDRSHSWYVLGNLGL